MTKKDYYIAALAGLIAAVFAIPTLFNLGVRNFLFFAGAIVLVPPIWAIGVWLGGFLSRWLSFLNQFGKFVAVGFMNTSLDFGILNILSILSGYTSGFIVGGVNVPGFLVAVVNSYFWNKLWVFKDREGNVLGDFPKFFSVTFLGLIINSGLVIFLTTYVSVPLAVSSSAWLNISKVFATAASLVWNFTGYKFVVFKSQGSSLPAASRP